MWRIFEQGGITGAALNLSVTTIGAGILALPSTFQEGGLFTVVMILFMVASLTVLSIDYLILCTNTLGLRSYEDISRELLGRSFEEAIRWVLIIYNIGIAAGYVVVIGEIFTPMLPLINLYVPWLNSGTRIVLVFWFFIMLPLSCIPHINKLNVASFLAISATCLISFVIVYRYYFPVDRNKMITTSHSTNKNTTISTNSIGNDARRIQLFALSSKTLLALPVMMFAFDCQGLVFQIYSNLNVKTRSTMIKVSSMSVLITGSAYAIVGFYGYITNTPHVRGNILTNYDPLRDHLFAIAEGVYSVTIIIAYVLVLFPCRDAVFILLCGFNSATHDLAHKAIMTHHNIVVSVVLSILSLLIALKAPGIVFIIAILGAACSSTVCFTYPGAFRLALHARGIARGTSTEILFAVMMIVFGLIGCVLGTAIALKL